MNTLNNIRYAARTLMRTPGFTAMVVITLGVGIGANTAVFSVLDAVLLRPLPLPNEDRLVRVRQVLETETQIAPARLDDWRRLSSTFEALSGYYLEDVSETTRTRSRCPQSLGSCSSSAPSRRPCLQRMRVDRPIQVLREE